MQVMAAITVTASHAQRHLGSKCKTLGVNIVDQIAIHYLGLTLLITTTVLLTSPFGSFTSFLVILFKWWSLSYAYKVYGTFICVPGLVVIRHSSGL